MKKLGLIILASLTAGCSVTPTSEVFEPNSVMNDTPLGDWGGKWWQWAFSFNQEISPVKDLTGKFCSLGQKGEVWFLAGSYSTDPVVRECRIPYGKKVFFPVINFIYHSNAQVRYSCSTVSEAAKRRVRKPSNLFVTLNGQPVAKPYLHREASTYCFDPFPHGEQTSSAYPAASDGYWVAFNSLPVGTHILKFGGELPNFKQDITYKLIVEPERQ